MKKLIVIGGPTASGKTELAIQLARHFDTEIINADSRQFYTRLDIGTAKPSKEELSQAVHHFIDFLEPDEEYNVGRFEQDVLNRLENIFARKDHAIVVGGSGLYIQTLCAGMDELPESDPEIRTKYNSMLERNGIELLQKLLYEKDQDYYNVVDLKNPHRLIRALEVIEQTGQTYSSLRKRKKTSRPFEIIKIAIDVSREELYDRINKRVDKMIDAGLIDEVNALLPYKNHNALQTVGYAEIFEFLEGKISKEEAIQLIKKNSRNYAKRQLTWFRRDEEFYWFNNNSIDPMIELIRNSE